jgi:hypothetical protein
MAEEQAEDVLVNKSFARLASRRGREIRAPRLT